MYKYNINERMMILKIRSNNNGTKWIEITNALLLFRPYREGRIPFWAPKAGIKNFFGLKLMCNCRFNIRKGHNKIVWAIRLPFFLWERTNVDWTFGLPNCYLWWHVARSKKRKQEWCI